MGLKERGGVNFDVNNSNANIGINVGSADYKNAFAGAHIGPHVEGAGGININIGTQDGRGERQNTAAQRDARRDQPEAAALRPRTEQELAQIHTDPIPFAYNGQTYDARHVLAAQEVADYLTIVATQDDQPLETRLVVLRVKIQALMEQAIDKGVVPPLPPEEPDHTPQPRPDDHHDDEPVVTEYPLTDAEFAHAVARLRAAFPPDSAQRPTDEQIRFIVLDVMMQRGADAPVPGDATVRTFEDIRAAIEAPEAIVGATYRISVQEFGYIIANELQQDTTITLANVEDKVREAVHKCIAEYATRAVPSDAREYSLDDFIRELGLEKEPAQGHTLTEEGFAWIVEEMLKPGSGILDVEQINDGEILKFETRVPDAIKMKGSSKAKLYTVQAFKDAVIQENQRRNELLRKEFMATPSRKYAILLSMYSSRVDQTNPLPIDVERSVNYIAKTWKQRRDMPENEALYTYQQIVDEYRTFDPSKKVENENSMTNGAFTEKEFATVIARLRDAHKMTAESITMEYFDDIARNLPANLIERGKVQRREYTLAEIRAALRGDTQKRESGKNPTYRMNEARQAYIIRELVRHGIDADNLRPDDIEEVVLTHAHALSESIFAGSEQAVPFDAIRNRLRTEHGVEAQRRSVVRTDAELDMIGAQLIIRIGEKRYDLRRLVDNPDEYAVFVAQIDSMDKDSKKWSSTQNLVYEEVQKRFQERKKALVEYS